MKYTCAHCKAGTVRELPSRCPECERLLTTEVENKFLYEEKNEHQEQKNPEIPSWGFSY
jgi:predicted ATP-dependent serine protease